MLVFLLSITLEMAGIGSSAVIIIYYTQNTDVLKFKFNYRLHIMNQKDKEVGNSKTVDIVVVSDL